MALALALAVLSCFSTSEPAQATALTLGTASTYGVLVGAGDKLAIGGGLTVTGDLGFGQNTTVAISKTNNSISGDVYQDSTLNITGTGSVSVSGNIYTQSMAQAFAISQITTAIANLLNEPG